MFVPTDVFIIDDTQVNGSLVRFGMNSTNLRKHPSAVSKFVLHGEQTLVEKDSPSSRTTKNSLFSRSANFGNVFPFLVGPTNTFSELIYPLLKLPNCVLKFYNLSEALDSFGLLPLRGAGTGFVGVLPPPLIFDLPLYILHSISLYTLHREATLKTALELLDRAEDSKPSADNNTRYSPSKSIT